MGSTVSSWLTRYIPHKADLIHATFQTIAPAAYFHRVSPFIVTVHDLAPLVYPEEVKDFSTRLQWQFTPSALHNADHLIAISEFTKQELCRLVDVSPDSITVVHQGVDHSVYRPMNRAQCRAYLGLDLGSRYILVVSSNEVHKRPGDAIGALKKVQSELDEVKLLKTGYGTDLDHDAVISTGWVDEPEMPMLYNAADVYLHTSEYEGFGLPILEALACGTPVISRSVASVPEIVGDVEQLAAADASAAQLGELAAERIRERPEGPSERLVRRSEEFSWERTARETKAVYEAVMAKCEC